jgi:hypothetical protein
VIVGTVKQSIAAMASGWLRRKASQRLAGSGSLGARSYPARNCSFGDIKTEHEKFSMDARRSPCGALGHHLEDQVPNFFRCLSCSDGLHGLETNAQYKQNPARCPPDYGLGRDDAEPRDFPGRDSGGFNRGV